MSTNGGDAFTSWTNDDTLFFIFSLFWPILLVLPVSLTFVVWSTIVLIVFGVITALANFVFSGGTILSVLAAITLLVWLTTFLIVCGVFYTALLEDYPKRNPGQGSTYAWWAGLAIVAGGLLGWRLFQNITPEGIVDLFWVVTVMLFGAYLVASRSFPLINTVSRGNSSTVTAGITGYMVGGVTIEISSYLLNGPFRNRLFDSVSFEMGMTFVYVPVLILGRFTDWLFRFAGRDQTVSTLISNYGLDNAVELATYNLNSGAGMYSALALSLIGIPLVVLSIELIYHGAVLGIVSRIETVLQNQNSSSGFRTGTPSRSNELITKVSDIATDGLTAVLNLFYDGFLFTTYILLAAVMAVVATLSLLVVLGVVNIFGGILPSVVSGIIEVGLVIVVLGTTLLMIGTAEADKIDGLGDFVLGDESTWDYPITLSLVGIVAIGLWGNRVFPPWTGIVPRIVSIAVVWIFLFRVAAYLTLYKEVNQTYRFTTRQQQISNLFADGEWVGRIVLGGGASWLSLGVVLPVIRAVDSSLVQPMIVSLNDLLSMLPMGISLEMSVIAVPLMLGSVAFLGAVSQSALISGVGYLPRIRRTARRIGDSIITIGKKMKRWIEYGILLRP